MSDQPGIFGYLLAIAVLSSATLVNAQEIVLTRSGATCA
ncbi:uncharacterized protein METZ01_LOCUS270145, partial [marine metagenome]